MSHCTVNISANPTAWVDPSTVSDPSEMPSSDCIQSNVDRLVSELRTAFPEISFDIITDDEPDDIYFIHHDADSSVRSLVSDYVNNVFEIHI